MKVLSSYWALIVAFVLKGSSFLSKDDIIYTMMKNPSHKPRRARASSKISENETPEATSSAATLMSRRGFLYGALGVGAVAIVGGGIAAANAMAPQEEGITYLEVPKDRMTPLGDFEALESQGGHLTLVNTFDIPYGTLIWVNDDSIAACLLPTDTGSPLTQVGILHLGTGDVTTIIEEPLGKADGYEIYDVRATSQGVIWTEANIMQNAWHIYGAPLVGGALGTPQLLDEGQQVYETPTLAAIDDQGFWQKMARDGTDDEIPTSILCAKFGSGEPEVILETQGKSATPLYGSNDSLIAAPRADSDSVYYTLTRIDATKHEVTDELTLPPSMKPLAAAWGPTGFMFSFPDIYDYGEGISNLGTYVPFELPEDGDYSSVRWFGFARTPSAAPAWADDLLIVKSTYSVCGVDLRNETYFAIDVENGADTYGEYLASTGDRQMFVTYTNVDHAPIGEEAIHACRVKLWSRGMLGA